MNIKIAATGHYVPKRIVDNFELSKIMDTSDDWIQSHTGIKTRHFAMNNENTSDLCTRVGKQLLEKSDLKPEEIDLILVSTITPDSLTPATACIVQDKLGATNAFAMDISAACAGFIFGLSTAEKFLRSGRYHNALVISGETNSKMMNFTDRTSAVFFGDGAGGALLETTENTNEEFFIDEKLQSVGSQHQTIHSGRIAPITKITGTNYPKLDAFYQDGRAVFTFATETVPVQMRQILNKNHVNVNSLDAIICHQANLRIIEKISAKLAVPMTKFPTNVTTFGNTSSAGIPMALDQLQRDTHRPQKVLLTGFGAGLDYGSMLINF
ncbi:beta-ketoacyl-ACP synthase III [Pediococcus ethanolidurans]|uniref:beta-ketoacyl-ACP synthase III n=1 Tax=Pediococcus ethanolidurans TaxID=319653 RepID=UPI002952E337|nr:beta-ketoacyl-ACP synthase III [Pediococcus ethanolidurans]MDV7719782.1 beta-ketoacyl-ACP synthase III [Pediococcus ethanolidurans]